MSLGLQCRTTLMTVAILLVVAAIGCAPLQVAVKDATGDKMGYLDKNFSVKNLSKSVAATITATDPGPLNFKKIVIVEVPEQELSAQTGAKPQYRSTMTYINAGGPFVQRMEELSSNNLAANLDYDLSYRGLFMLRQQHMKLANNMSGVMYETKSIKQFTAWTPGKPGGGTLEIRDEAGTPPQLMNFKSTALACKFGDVFPATQIHQKLSGNAQWLDCELSNDNGVVTMRSKKALLMNYGLAIVTRNEGTNFATNFKIVDVEIQ